MKKISVSDQANRFFVPVWEIYESSFPLNERRSLESQLQVFANKNYHLEIWTKNETVSGLIGWWDCPGFRFIEHYAIHPEYRSLGYGSRFLSEWMREFEIPILLEIEPVVDELTRKRQCFYQKLGFIDNDILHFQPPYHKNMKPLQLWLMSYPEVISREQYELFFLHQQTEIMKDCFKF